MKFKKTFFWGFSRVFLEYSPQHKYCRSCWQQLYVAQFFLSPFFLFFFILEFRMFLFILLFFSTLLSVPCSVLSLSVYSLYLLIPLIAFFSNLLFLFSFPMTLFCLFLLYVLLLFNLTTFCYLIFLEPSV